VWREANTQQLYCASLSSVAHCPLAHSAGLCVLHKPGRDPPPRHDLWRLFVVSCSFLWKQHCAVLLLCSVASVWWASCSCSEKRFSC
jgi:hypothetical protein